MTAKKFTIASKSEYMDKLEQLIKEYKQTESPTKLKEIGRVGRKINDLNGIGWEFTLYEQ